MADYEKGGLRERYQYYQEMRANGEWDHRFRLPTREEYRQWLILDTEGPVAGPFSSAAEQQRWEELKTLQQERQAIDAVTAELRQHVDGIGLSGHEQAWVIGEHGMNIGEQGNKLSTGGPGEWVSPKLHPVWASAIAHEAGTLERMSEATFVYEPLYQKLEAWREAGTIDTQTDWEMELGIAPGQAPRFYVLDALVSEAYQEADWYGQEHMRKGIEQELKSQGIQGRVIVLAAPNPGASLAERLLFERDLGGVQSQAFLAWEREQRGEVDGTRVGKAVSETVMSTADGEQELQEPTRPEWMDVMQEFLEQAKQLHERAKALPSVTAEQTHTHDQEMSD
jgi:hypothetical protein